MYSSIKGSAKVSSSLENPFNKGSYTEQFRSEDGINSNKSKQKMQLVWEKDKEKRKEEERKKQMD